MSPPAFEAEYGLDGRSGVVLARAMRRLDVAVHLVGRHLDEPCTVLARPAQEDVRAEHVGLDELGPAEDRAVDVRLGGEVDDRIAALLPA